MRGSKHGRGTPPAPLPWQPAPSCKHGHSTAAPVQRRLVDAAHLVEHKQRGQQHGQREDLGAVLARLQVGERRWQSHESVGAGRSSSPAGHSANVQPTGIADRTSLHVTGNPLSTCTHLVIRIDALRVQQHQRVLGAVGAAALHGGRPHPQACARGWAHDAAVSTRMADSLQYLCFPSCQASQRHQPPPHHRAHPWCRAGAWAPPGSRRCGPAAGSG